MRSPVLYLKVLPHAVGLPLPAYETQGASGMDLPAALPEEEDLVLEPLARILIPTGFSLEIPSGYEAQLRPRSGLAARQGITLLNAPGTIDSDYRGEIKVLLINLGKEAFSIVRGMRIAQLVIAPVVQAKLQSIEILSETKRGEGGFGSTGLALREAESRSKENDQPIS